MLQLGVASPLPSGYETPNNREQVFIYAWFILQTYQSMKNWKFWEKDSSPLIVWEVCPQILCIWGRSTEIIFS